MDEKPGRKVMLYAATTRLHGLEVGCCSCLSITAPRVKPSCIFRAHCRRFHCTAQHSTLVLRDLQQCVWHPLEFFFFHQVAKAVVRTTFPKHSHPGSNPHLFPCSYISSKKSAFSIDSQSNTSLFPADRVAIFDFCINDELIQEFQLYFIFPTIWPLSRLLLLLWISTAL